MKHIITAQEFLKSFAHEYREDLDSLTICVEVKLYNPVIKDFVHYCLPLKPIMEPECFVDEGEDEFVFKIGSVDVMSILSDLGEGCINEGIIE